MLNFTGKISVFGGKYDEGMVNDSGLALYEPKEANLRPDLFVKAPPDEPNQATWKRLRISSFYVAYRFDHEIRRWRLQETPVKVINQKTEKFVLAWLVDWGPSEDTGRAIDVSPAVSAALGVDTDDVVDVEVDI